MSMDRPLKVATPATAGCVAVPFRVPPGPALLPIANVTFDVDAVKLPPASKTRTVTAGVIVAVEAVFDGWTPKTTWVAEPTVILNGRLVAGANTSSVAVSV